MLISRHWNSELYPRPETFFFLPINSYTSFKENTAFISGFHIDLVPKPGTKAGLFLNEEFIYLFYMTSLPRKQKRM